MPTQWPPRKRETGCIKYSETIPGQARNYYWPVRFDESDGFLGINQECDNSAGFQRVLLSPAQVRELLAFLEGCQKPSSH